jgi:hypothetical protein
MNKITFTLSLAVAFVGNTALFGQGFTEPYCGSKIYERYAPTRVESTDTRKINLPIGQTKADELAKAFGLQKDKCFTPIQFFTFITGGGYGGNLTNALMIADATLILTNTKQNPIVRNINGNATTIVLGSYGLTVNEDGLLESCAQKTSPCRTVNAILAPGGWMDNWCKANGATKSLENLYSLAYTTEAVYSVLSQNNSGEAQLVSYNLTNSSSVKVGMSMIPPLWIVNFCLIYTLNPELAALMPAYWTDIPQQVATDIMNSPEGQVSYSYYQQYFPAQSMVDEDSSTPSLLPITTALASDFSSKIQKALAQGSANTRSASDIASILGVSKSNLSKTLKLAPEGIKSSNGKISLSKLNKFLSKKSKNTSLLTGETRKRVKNSK